MKNPLPWRRKLIALRMKKPMRANKHPWFLCAFLTGLLTISAWPANLSAPTPQRGALWGIAPPLLSAALSADIAANRFPRTIRPPNFPIHGALTVHYTVDPALQAETERLLRKYKPDYGVVVALEPESGRLLAMASSARNGDPIGNLALSNRHPAASISKIVTAVAAINENKATADTVVAFNGKSTSLYKKNVFAHRNTKWTRKYSLRRAFAGSVNTVFGRVGAVEVGGETMLAYAERLGFNGNFAADFMFANGNMQMNTEDRWQVAEAASGYTARNTLSPLHGAALAATAVNGGNLVTPMLVREVTGPNGVPLYWHAQPTQSKIMRDDTARQLKRMMRDTVIVGSAKNSFAKFHRGNLKDVLVGGKTGSLSGLSPKGKYDWFVGFGEQGARKIAYAVLCINRQRWYVKSARLAREMLEFYFREIPVDNLAQATF